jgi:hypothetical protein
MGAGVFKELYDISSRSTKHKVDKSKYDIEFEKSESNCTFKPNLDQTKKYNKCR